MPGSLTPSGISIPTVPEFTLVVLPVQRPKNNAGWRIDYFIVSDSPQDRIRDLKILTDITGSDHCPVELDIEF